MSKKYKQQWVHLKEQAVNDWESAVYLDCWEPLQRFTYLQKRQNEQYLKLASSNLIELLKPLTREDFTSERVQHELESFFQHAIHQCPFLLEDEKKYLCSSSQLEASKSFIDQFMDEDSGLTIENLGQAMRNFWIANLLQACFMKPVKNTEALYGYSLLYPYSDNLMDCLTSDKAEKTAFCKRLTAHLLGEPQQGRTPEEERIFELVDKIYNDFPIDQFPSVQMGLLGIHEAQAESLKQQQSHLLPYEVDLLGKSFQKGGTSLLADGFLVKPEMSDKEQLFCFGFGAILQLCDDLQDAETDYLAQHYTLFSQLKGRYALDSLLKKMNGYLEFLMNQLVQINEQTTYDLPLVIGRNTKLLLAYAILDHQECFTRQFTKEIKQFLPIRPKAMKKIARQLKSQMKQMSLFTTMDSAKNLMNQPIEVIKNSGII